MNDIADDILSECFLFAHDLLLMDRVISPFEEATILMLFQPGVIFGSLLLTLKN